MYLPLPAGNPSFKALTEYRRAFFTMGILTYSGVSSRTIASGLGFTSRRCETADGFKFMDCVLETDRLMLRPMTHKDIDFVATLIVDPKVAPHWPKHLLEALARDWVDRQLARYREDGCGYWIVVAKKSGESIGQAGLINVEVEGTKELCLGVMVAKKHWNRRIGTEAATGCMAYAREVLERTRVAALIRPNNARALRLAAALGMAKESDLNYAGLQHVLLSSNL